MSGSLTEDTKAIILLCATLDKDRTIKPLTPTEYNRLADWLQKKGLRPENMHDPELIPEASQETTLDEERLSLLLSRGFQLALAVEEWQRSGLWILSRSDAEYPKRYKAHLRKQAPPLLFGAGDRRLLQGGGLGMVGSRNVDTVGEEFTRRVATLCAHNLFPVVSGAARGVDQISMETALRSGGSAIGIVCENLLKKSVQFETRQALADGNLLLLSPYHPTAHFTAGRAMARNKLIYAMAGCTLVVASDFNKGGTWSGASEELRRESPLPVFVRAGHNVPEGNSKLIELGALPWMMPFDGVDFRQHLKTQIKLFQDTRAKPRKALANKGAQLELGF